MPTYSLSIATELFLEALRAEEDIYKRRDALDTIKAEFCIWCGEKTRRCNCTRDE